MCVYIYIEVKRKSRRGRIERIFEKKGIGIKDKGISYWISLVIFSLA